MKNNDLFQWVKAERHKLFFFFTIVLYIILYAPYGFTEGDDGFISALAWRIYNGEIPYKDFIYVRPPVTILQHTLPFFILPLDLIIISERVLFYISLGASCYFASKTISSLVDLKKYHLNVYLIASVGYIFSVNSFAPMAWHTIDGIFFGSIGIYFLVARKTVVSTAIGMVFLLLSALTKQSFYLMPIAGFGYLLFDRRGSKAAATAIVSLVVSIIGFILVLMYFESWEEFLSQTTGSTSIRDGYTSGVYVYIHTDILFYLVPTIIWKLWDFASKGKSWQPGPSSFPYIFVLFTYVYTLAFYLNAFYVKDLSEIEYLHLEYMDPFARIGFLAVTTYLFFTKANRSFISGVALLLFLAWCSSISWAHSSPHLFATPVMAVLVLMARQYFDVERPGRFAYFLIVVGFLVYLIAYQKPYLSDTRENMVYDLGKVNPRLSWVYGDVRINRKLSELDSLVIKYGTNFKVLPAMPLANMLHKKNSPVSIDWALNCEVAGREDRLFNELEKSKAVVFIDRQALLGEIKLKDEDRKYGSSLTMKIYRKWEKIDSLSQFWVYKSTKSNK